MLAALGAVAPLSCLAEVMLASPFTDHAVLQRDLPVPIWGHASAGEKIIVRFHDQKRETIASEHGR